MNAERLLALYERVAEAPDAIARLRRFILDLAVRGKLVPQDPNDEPASELLKRIAKEQIDKAALPRGWHRAKVGSILDFQYGKGLKAAERLDEGPVPVFGSNGIVGFTDEPLTARPSIIVGRKGSAGALNLCDGPSWTTDVAYFVEAPSFLDLRFLLSALASLDLDKLGKGVKPGLSRSEAYEQVLALPPLAEQHRIVAKVDELMALCDQLEAARQERESRRDRLAAASLARLNAPDPETFQSDARFILNALPALTTRPNQIKQLRQTILNLAVRGKLVPQDPSNEPASELLKRIAKEKARLVKAGEVKKEKPLEPITVENQPFNLPQSWSWVRLDFLSRLITKGSSPKWQGVNYVNADDGILFITSENVGNHELRKLDDLKYVESRFRDIEPRSMLRRGDILMNLVGASIGRTAIYNLDAEANINQAVALIRLVEISDGPLVRYLLQYLNSPTAIESMLGSRVITAQPNMSLTDTREFPIPLPPLAEQHRIVAKVDELMALCDRLEASLTTSNQTRTRLLEATLAEALAPASISEMEAAE
jgi:type I restriction enzyme S subunit